MRFQVEYPTPLASVLAFVSSADRATFLSSYERALFADLAARLDADLPGADGSLG